MNKLSFADLIFLAPAGWHHGALLLSFFCVVCYLLRIALMLEGVRSAFVHAVVCTLTLLPAIVLAIVLLFAARAYPTRAWMNLAIAFGIYVAWYLGGAITRLVRPDAEGGDLGWITMGALITFPVGAVAALIFT
jgi:hypothetical protein